MIFLDPVEAQRENDEFAKRQAEAESFPHMWDDTLDPGGTPRCFWCDVRPSAKGMATPCRRR